MQKASDQIPNLLDPEAAGGVEEARAVQDGNRPDVLGLPEVLRPDHAEIRRGQALDRRDGPSPAL